MANLHLGFGFLKPERIRKTDRCDFYRSKYRRFCHSTIVSMTLSMFVCFAFFFVNLTTNSISNAPLLFAFDAVPLVTWILLYSLLIRRNDIHCRWKLRSMYFCSWLTLTCILLSHYVLDFTGGFVLDLALAHLILFIIGISHRPGDRS